MGNLEGPKALGHFTGHPQFWISRTATACSRVTLHSEQGCKRDFEVRDRDETETETLIGRDRDIFRDLGTLSFISEVFLPCISFCFLLN